MYRIDGDKRKVRSAALICAALERLLQDYAYEAITVTRIIQESGVGRATFYRLFDDKSDVILYQMETVFDDLLTHMGAQTEPTIIISSLFELWLGHENLFLSLISAGLYNDFQTRLALVIEEKLSFIKEGKRIDDRTWHYFVTIRAAMLFAALRVAITRYRDDDAQAIMRTLDSLFGSQPAILRPA